MLLYRHVIVYTCVHCILYAKINKQLVLGYVVARLDVRERMVVPSWTVRPTHMDFKETLSHGRIILII